MSEAFEAKFASFFEGVKKIYADYKAAHYALNPDYPWEIKRGKRYICIIHNGSYHTYVDTLNGDVLKPAGKTPAKHARGNIFDAHNGLGAMGPYGPAYLK